MGAFTLWSSKGSPSICGVGVSQRRSGSTSFTRVNGSVSVKRSAGPGQPSPAQHAYPHAGKAPNGRYPEGTNALPRPSVARAPPFFSGRSPASAPG